MPIYLVDVDVTRNQRVKVEAQTEREARRLATKQEHWLDVVSDDPVIHIEPTSAWQTED